MSTTRWNASWFRESFKQRIIHILWLLSRIFTETLKSLLSVNLRIWLCKQSQTTETLCYVLSEDTEVKQESKAALSCSFWNTITISVSSFLPLYLKLHILIRLLNLHFVYCYTMETFFTLSISHTKTLNKQSTPLCRCKDCHLSMLLSRKKTDELGKNERERKLVD